MHRSRLVRADATPISEHRALVALVLVPSMCVVFEQSARFGIAVVNDNIYNVYIYSFPITLSAHDFCTTAKVTIVSMVFNLIYIDWFYFQAHNFSVRFFKKSNMKASRRL